MRVRPTWQASRAVHAEQGALRRARGQKLLTKIPREGRCRPCPGVGRLQTDRSAPEAAARTLACLQICSHLSVADVPAPSASTFFFVFLSGKQREGTKRVDSKPAWLGGRERGTSSSTATTTVAKTTMAKTTTNTNATVRNTNDNKGHSCCRAVCWVACLPVAGSAIGSCPGAASRPNRRSPRPTRTGEPVVTARDSFAVVMCPPRLRFRLGCFY